MALCLSHNIEQPSVQSFTHILYFQRFGALLHCINQYAQKIAYNIQNEGKNINECTVERQNTEFSLRRHWRVISL